MEVQTLLEAITFVSTGNAEMMMPCTDCAVCVFCSLTQVLHMAGCRGFDVGLSQSQCQSQYQYQCTV